MSTFPKTRAAAGSIVGHGPGDLARVRAAVLLTRLGACEDALAGGDGEIPAPAQGLLRGLVIAARDLVGRRWLAASDDDPDIAAFIALDRAPVPPSPAELDQIISRVLRARFAASWQHLPGQHRHPGAAPAAVRTRQENMRPLSSTSSGPGGTKESRRQPAAVAAIAIVRRERKVA